ncbi:ankyrin repeat domain-containing protein 2-like [Zophobas morio]|uniref:ankyrin repeat domain-containing protein 2-like n=1 Tax=Zophobas morio TaxID=2755281 RepID=UPI003083EC86
MWLHTHYFLGNLVTKVCRDFPLFVVETLSVIRKNALEAYYFYKLTKDDRSVFSFKNLLFFFQASLLEAEPKLLFFIATLLLLLFLISSRKLYKTGNGVPTTENYKYITSRLDQIYIQQRKTFHLCLKYLQQFRRSVDFIDKNDNFKIFFKKHKESLVFLENSFKEGVMNLLVNQRLTQEAFEQSVEELKKLFENLKISREEEKKSIYRKIVVLRKTAKSLVRHHRLFLKSITTGRPIAFKPELKFENAFVHNLTVDIRFDRFESVKQSLEGHDIRSLLNENGRTLLHVSAQYKKLEALKLFINMGLAVNVMDPENITPLHLAASRGWKEGVEYLLLNGASVNARDIRGNTALHCAVRGIWTEHENEDLVLLLLQHEADVNARDELGRTPLHAAELLEPMPVKIAYEFIKRGFDITLTDIKGRSILYAAVKKGDVQLLQYFMNTSAKLDHKDSAGLTIIDYAKKKLSKATENSASDDSSKESGGPDNISAYHEILDILEKARDFESSWSDPAPSDGSLSETNY